MKTLILSSTKKSPQTISKHIKYPSSIKQEALKFKRQGLYTYIHKRILYDKMWALFHHSTIADGWMDNGLIIEMH